MTALKSLNDLEQHEASVLDRLRAAGIKPWTLEQMLDYQERVVAALQLTALEKFRMKNEQRNGVWGLLIRVAFGAAVGYLCAIILAQVGISYVAYHLMAVWLGIETFQKPGKLLVRWLESSYWWFHELQQEGDTPFYVNRFGRKTYLPDFAVAAYANAKSVVPHGRFSVGTIGPDPILRLEVTSPAGVREYYAVIIWDGKKIVPNPAEDYSTAA